MKYLTIAAVFAALVAVALTKPQDKYTNKYDGIDIDNILKNDRLVNAYCKCLLEDNGKCTPDGQELKRTLPDALNNECSKCSEFQKERAEVVIRHLATHKEECWKNLTRKYDPKEEHKKKWAHFAEEKGIKV